ncbi:MAG TPA: DUF4203 domain-containing protein [Anaerolineae bacterium]|nr:DUF4203 domain-containing protein [Anaerolineae bacterium]
MLATITLALFAVLLGAALLLAGYRFFLVMLPIWGFFGGLWLGAYSVTLIFGTGFLATATGLVVGFVVGLIGAVLSYLFYMAGVIIISGALGGALGSGVMSALGFDPGLIMAIVTIVSALVAVGLTLLFSLQKLMLIIFTAIAGAALVVLSGMLVFGQVTLAELQAGTNLLQPIFQGSWFWGLVWLMLAVAGGLVQFRANRTYAFTNEMYVEGWG